MIGITNNCLLVIVFGLLGAFPVGAHADSFQPSDAVLKIIEKSYSKFEIRNDSTCLRVSAGGEFCAIAIDKTVEENIDFRDVDMLLTYSKTGEIIDIFKIYNDFLGGDAITYEITKIDFNIWDKLRSTGQIFSITISAYGSSRVNQYHENQLTFFKLMNSEIITISEPLSIYLYTNENNGQDKFSAHTVKRIIIIKEKDNSQVLSIRVSVCDDDDTILEKDRCDNKKPKWMNEEELKFNEQSIKFLNKSYFN